GTRAAVEAFRAQAADGVRGGEIGITASLSAHGPVPGLSVYAATKAAVLSLATSLSAELRKEKIRVHAICPDGVCTPMLHSMTNGGQGRALVASGKTYEPAEVARTFVAMFGTRRVYRTMPVWRGALVRLTGLAPGPLMRLEPVMRKIGERKLRKEA
ncbi:MAG TPA: SDR family oxidoreductase, partial [Coriobacteriia bacterium]|nr:SDR family oxidoreductase [Coriobacteriia bacterium]